MVSKLCFNVYETNRFLQSTYSIPLIVLNDPCTQWSNQEIKSLHHHKVICDAHFLWLSRGTVSDPIWKCQVITKRRNWEWRFIKKLFDDCELNYYQRFAKSTKPKAWINDCIHVKLSLQWARWCLKSPASILFTQSFVLALIKENIKAPDHWSLCGEFTGERWIPLTKGQ